MSPADFQLREGAEPTRGILSYIDATIGLFVFVWVLRRMGACDKMQGTQRPAYQCPTAGCSSLCSFNQKRGGLLTIPNGCTTGMIQLWSNPMLALRILYGVLATLATLAICVLAFYALHSLLIMAPSKNAVAVDFNAILTVLLTTVSVIFTVCAIVLAVLGLIGFRNLKRDAGRFAETQALAEITRAFGPSGSGTNRIEQHMLDENGHHRQFVEKRIRHEVITLLPLIADRISPDALRFAPDTPTDEGDVD